MAIAVDREPFASRDQLRPTHAVAAVGALGWLAVGAAGSLAAGAIHAAAIGVHSEHRQAVIAFTVVAAIQLGWGAIALTRPGRIVVALGAVANAAIFGGWVLAKVSGISFIDGLGDVESPQLADSLAAGLAVVAVLAAVFHLLSIGSRALTKSPLLTGVSAILIASLAVPGMVAAGSHSHAGGHGHDDGAAAHSHDDGSGAAHAETASAVPPKPYDPALPIDLGGVEGVTLQQQAAAENLLAITITRLPQFADPAVAESMGFVSIGDGFLGHEHYLNAANMNDDKLLDPDYPESLVYDTTVTPKKLVAAMYMMNPGETLADVPELGGKLTQWHVHDNLCFAGARVAGLTDADGNCASGLTKGAETPMIHVWITPHECGPFSALDGVAGGTIPEGEARLCDHVHGAS
jgi:hypothetical protein